jgi:hypothetical protein
MRGESNPFSCTAPDCKGLWRGRVDVKKIATYFDVLANIHLTIIVDVIFLVKIDDYSLYQSATHWKLTPIKTVHKYIY